MTITVYNVLVILPRHDIMIRSDAGVRVRIVYFMVWISDHLMYRIG